MRFDGELQGRQRSALSTPSSPPAGSRLLYPKSTGWFDKASDGTETRLSSGLFTVPFVRTDTLAVVTSPPWVSHPTKFYEIVAVSGYVVTAPVGQDITFDILNDGAAISATAFHVVDGTHDITQPALTAGNLALSTSGRITLDITQVGTTQAGANLDVCVWIKESQ